MASTAPPPPPDDGQTPAEPPSCADVGWLSFLTFTWVNPLVEKGQEQQIELASTPRLAPSEDTLRNTHVLLQHLERAEKGRKTHPLLRAVVFTYWKEFLVLEVLNVANHFLGLLNPLLLKQVLVFQEEQGKSEEVPMEQVRKGIACVMAMIGLGLFQIIFSTHINLFQNRVDVRIGGALRGLVLHRCIQGRRRRDLDEPGAIEEVPSSSGAAREPGAKGPAVYNVLSFDVGPNVSIIWTILAMWIFPIEIVSTLTVLFSQVKWAIIPGMAVIITAKLICGVLLFCDGVYRRRLLSVKDLRLSSCAEGFHSIRTLQMLTWVGPFEDRIMAARRQELSIQCRRLWLQKMGAALDYSLGVMVNLATFAYFILRSHQEMKASTALPVVSLVSHLIGPFGKIPGWINQYLVWRSAYDRVNEFLGLNAWPAGRAPGSSSGLGGSGGSPGAGEEADAGLVVAAFDACSLSWGTSGATVPQLADGTLAAEQEPLLKHDGGSFSLRELSLKLRGGEMLVVVAEAGQGKSSLLQALLGEMVLDSGKVTSPAILRRTREEALPATTEEARVLLAARRQGAAEQHAEPLAVPYAAQEVILMTGTVRWNIQFGSRQDNEIYQRVLRACALEEDLATMPAGDLSEIAQGGSTLSGGQRARVGLARAVYQAALMREDWPESAPLVLFDDVLCALDRRVASQICTGLFASPDGLLSKCCVVVATADPWWLEVLAAMRTTEEELQVSVMRSGSVCGHGTLAEVRDKGFKELEHIAPLSTAAGSFAHGDQPKELPQPQDGDDEDDPTTGIEPAEEQELISKPSKLSEDSGHRSGSKLCAKMGSILQEEHREDGAVGWSTYREYFLAVGPIMLTVLTVALIGIMAFQNCCNLWIVYWTSDSKEKTFMDKWVRKFTDQPPTAPEALLLVYGCFVALFTICNFAGHGIEIVGGIRAAGQIFADALLGTLGRPFRWWDANPTGRVLNRFSEDVEVMDLAITNIMGVIFGAGIYFVSHCAILGIANPLSLILLPFIGFGLEYFARYYRVTIREVQRVYLVSMSSVYQEMVEAVVGQVTIRAFGTVQQVLCSGFDSVDRFQRISFGKMAVGQWIGFRMELIGYSLGTFNKLYPVLQFFRIFSPMSAALVGFSITYSQDVIGIMRQLIMNWSDMEMQLISIERLREYAGSEQARPPAIGSASFGGPKYQEGLALESVSVTYREDLPPALSSVTLYFAPKVTAAIVGRTGAGKSSLLLSILQLVPYTGHIDVAGERLGLLDPEAVRQRLVAVVPQQPVLFAGTLRWNLDPKGVHSDAELWEALQAVGLQSHCRSPGAGLEVELALAGQDSGAAGGAAASLSFSKGQVQTLAAARALLRRPRVVLLDEVTASLPPDTALETVRTLFTRFQQLRAVVLLVTHQEELMPLCDRIITVAGGRILADRPRAA